jgi:probable HAF family extracellular repeat protein
MIDAPNNPVPGEMPPRGPSGPATKLRGVVGGGQCRRPWIPSGWRICAGIALLDLVHAACFNYFRAMQRAPGRETIMGSNLSSSATKHLLLALVSVGFAMAIPSTSGAQSFQGLGFLPGGNLSLAYGVNADGTVVVGQSNNANGINQAFRWTAIGGMVSLGFLPGGSNSFATGVNADGTVVVGSSASSGASGGGNQAFRWTAASGMVGLGGLSGGNSDALAVNADGNVVVGQSSNSDTPFQAFRWTAIGGMVGLGFLPGYNSSYATGANADGTVAVGVDSTASGLFQAFRWTAAGGMVGLGGLSGGNSEALAVNADGSVVVGCSGLNGLCNEAFRWTAATGMQSVQALLTASGVSTTGWALTNAQSVSADGTVLVGVGRDPSGHEQAWIAHVRLPALQVSPATNIAASGIQGELFSPTSFQYQLTSTVGSLNYSISGIPTWLNANITSGTATTTPVTVTFSLTTLGSLTPGSYAATIAFTNTNNGNGNTTRTATLTVNAGSKDGCKDGGWQNYIFSPGPFKNQGQCASYFAKQ